MESNSIQNLLQQVSAIRKHYDKIAEATGENFNIFKILKVQTKEVRLHSALLAELLNPKGSHGQKDIFLKQFVQLIEINDFDTSNASVEVEKHAGWINEECTEGGYIDLVITSSKNQRIIIENKIYAGDQENQLFRYHQYDKNALLFYLSLDGKTPSDWSTNGLEQDKHYRIISYRSTIINWLESCKKESVNHPLLRETITQYINLIKFLTGQSTNFMMTNDIKNVIFHNYESYLSAEQIWRELPNLKTELAQSFWSKLNSEWKRRIIISNKLPDGYKIIFDVYDEDELHYGFTLENEGEEVKKPNEYLSILIDLLKSIDINFKDWPGWIGWKCPDISLNFNAIHLSKEVFELSDEKKLVNYIQKLILEMNNYIDQFEAKLESATIPIIEKDILQY